MVQEDKQLLLKDLCARLPYGVKVQYKGNQYDLTEMHKDGRTYLGSHNSIYGDWHCSLEFEDYPKPYLRPMSSMTEEEEKELKSTLPFSISFSWDVNNEFIIYTDSEYDGDHYFSCFVDIQDWHNAHHFDYRNLIEKGLALEAPEDMYKEE